MSSLRTLLRDARELIGKDDKSRWILVVLVAVIAGAALFGSSKGSPMNGHGEVAALRAEVDRLRRDRNAGSEVR